MAASWRAISTAAPSAAIWRGPRSRGTNATASASPAAATLTSVCTHSIDVWPQMLNGEGRETW